MLRNRRKKRNLPLTSSVSFHRQALPATQRAKDIERMKKGWPGIPVVVAEEREGVGA
jgi:hypothetical protein